MKSVLEKRKIRKILYSPLVIVPLAFVVGFLGTSVWSVYTKAKETRIKRDKQASELESLQTRASALEAEIERLETERGKEEEIRRKFEVAREGERVIVIVDPKEEEEVEVVEEPKLRWWQKVLSWF